MRTSKEKSYALPTTSRDTTVTSFWNNVTAQYRRVNQLVKGASKMLRSRSSAENPKEVALSKDAL